MKKFGIVVLVIIISVASIKISPVWIHRLFGYSGRADKIFSPYWINNEEYCYLRVKSYYATITIWPTLFQAVDGLLRGPNATFYIYKVNINQPNEKKLIRKITEKVDFWISPEEPKLPLGGEEFTFKRLDNGELILLIKGRLKYIAYNMNTNGKVLKKRVFGFSYIEGNPIIDISTDGKKFLISHNGAYIKDITSREEILFSKWDDKYYGPTRWIYKNKLIVYNFHPLNKEEHWKDTRCDIYLIDEKKESINLIYSSMFKKSEEATFFSLDATLSPNSSLIFLTKIGIFEKQNDNWQMLMDLNDMEFNYFYPNWSSDGRRIVGVVDNKNLRVVEVKDLLKD